MPTTFKPIWPPEKQIKRLFAVSGMYSNGPTDHAGRRSRMLALAAAKATGAKTTSDQAYATPIFAKTTGKKYESVATSLLRFCRDTGRADTIDQVTPHHVKDFLMAKLGCKKASFDTYTAAIGKLDAALAKACERPPQWKDLLRDLRKVAAITLDGEQSARAYSRPKDLIERLTDNYRLVAELQYRGGLRISEASGSGTFAPLSAANLRGVTFDSYLKCAAGVIAVTGKGGKTREVPIPLDLYQRLENYLREKDQLRVHQGMYRSLLRDAAQQTSQRYDSRSTHGLRWCYVQDITDLLCGLG